MSKKIGSLVQNSQRSLKKNNAANNAIRYPSCSYYDWCLTEEN